ncbi:hypothetical protein [Streptomyces sp. AC1-42T]|uniref:hypothetical protein n=1 Tax=Streptomyces sp. AC1-42T TaxID=2218665 RepID=UPI000DAC8EE2|nr:hypothetical protein [Streptomyces sp. AC1-42T]PZT71493.1 hypothetical protein DNK55_32800 [Streptomyces sp. AC1-42T]
MPEGEVALELSELRRSLEVGLARIDGQLALNFQRSDQIDKDVEDLQTRVAALERARWPLPTLSVLIALGSLALGAWGALGK